MTARMSGVESGLIAAIVALVLVATVGTANQYGATYDEPHYASAGVAYSDWWTRVVRGDFSALEQSEIEGAWGLNHEHPPLQKCASGFTQRWFQRGPLGGLRAMRLPSAIWFALTVGAVYLFTRRIWGGRGALFGALALAVMPRVIAHAHFNALDMPIACWFFITAAVTAEAMRRNSWRWAAAAGLAFGLALMSKLNALFLPILLLPWGLVYYRDRWPKLVVPLFVIGPAVFLLGWPWLWIDFLPHLREYLAFHLRHADYNIWYLGRLWEDEPAPWHYPFVLAAVTTPAFVLGLALVGVVRAWHRREASPEATLLLCGLLIALLPNALPNSPKYNGVRLFLPAFPFLVALAGGGFAWLQSKVTALLKSDSPDRARLAPLVAAALGAILLLPGLSGAARTHPYELAYYNSLVGGTKGATERGFETIYWGQSLAEAPPFLNGLRQSHPLVLVIPKGTIYLLELQQQVGSIRPDVRFTAEEAQATVVDAVLFQAMQSDYTELCWTLVQKAEPTFEVTVEDTPVVLGYERRVVLEAMAGL
jgi:hypothetical protein